jgi:uncharacterized protein YbjT (DUF2867 family)
MKIVVIGGSGLIGTNVVNRLRARDHEVVAASPASGVNTITGEGLAEALSGAEVVVDVANSPSFEDAAVMEFFETAGRNLMAAEIAAGVKHHLALSVVGAERVPASGYLRAKLAQEKLIKESGVPYTILRSTQFFEFVNGIIDAGATVTWCACRRLCFSPSPRTMLLRRWPNWRSEPRAMPRSRSPAPKPALSTRSPRSSWPRKETAAG